MTNIIKQYKEDSSLSFVELAKLVGLSPQQIRLITRYSKKEFGKMPIETASRIKVTTGVDVMEYFNSLD